MEDHVIFCQTPEEVADAAAELIFEKQTEAVAERGVFRIALSGGSTPKLLFERLAADEWRDEMSWEHWEVYWADERAVPPDHPESNFRLAHSALLSKIPVSKVFRMETEATDLTQAAKEYADLLVRQLGESLPVFDVILLGLGTDGHTASLFPGNKTTTPQSPTGGLESSDELVLAVNVASAKIPRRLTLTYPVLNAARTVVFLITGEEKAEAVRAILQDGNPALPATHVKPEDGECYWILDEAAAHLLE